LRVSERTDEAILAIKGAVAPDAAASQAAGTAVAPLGTPENPSSQIFTVANVITFLRFVLTIVFLFLFVQGGPTKRAIAVTLYSIAAITDFLDGQIARATQTVSWLGKIMDPIMDRVLLFTGVLGLVFTGELPLWVAIIVIGRDIVLAGGSAWLRCYRKRPMDVIYVGKAATFFLMFGFADMLLAIPQVRGLGITDASWLPGLNGQTVAAGIFFVYIGAVLSLITAVIYYYKGLKIRHQVLDERKRQAS
jgi:cardiolipin synthase